MSKTIERERAERGAALLDEKKPGWEWHEEFDDLRTLDIRSGCNCVLGKLFGDWAIYGLNGYFIGIDELGITGIWRGSRAWDHGFLGHGKQTEAWCELITERRDDWLRSVEMGLEGVRTDEAAEALSEHPVAV